MNITKETKDDIIYIRVNEPELRYDLSENFKRMLFDIIDGDARHLIVSLSEVQFLDSTALGAFVAANTRLSAKDRKFCLVALQPKTASVLKLTSLDKYLNIYENEQEAVSELTA